MSLRGWLDGYQRPAVPPPVPVDVPMSADRPPADYEDDSRPLTTVRVSLSTEIGRPAYARVETVARDGLAQKVLVGRALPLLARARRLLDEIADCTRVDGGIVVPGKLAEHVEPLANAIVHLIGHSVTGAPPAPELEAVLAEGTPARLTREQLDQLGDDVIVPSTSMPLDSVETPAEKAARHERINEALERMGVEVIPPCPMAPYAEPTDWEREREAAAPFMGRESREPAAPVDTPTALALATRLDREARDAQKAYARAVQAADEAWRQLGGRP